MGLFGVELRAPSLPSLSDIGSSVRKGLDSARDLGTSALNGGSQLGQAGLDLGRRALADPEGAVRSVAAAARQGVQDGTHAVQGGLRDGVMWTGRQIHAGADLARSAVPGDNVVSNAIRDGITGAEDRARFTVGVTGGVLSEGTGLVGTVGTLGISAAELQVSPTARQELGTSILSGLQRGGTAVVDYGQAVANDPSRVFGDVRDTAVAGYDATAGFVSGQVQRHEDAFKRGEGWETLGMTTGQVATYVVPIGGGPVRGLAQAGVRAAARDGAELVVRDVVESAGARFGNAVSNDYRATFFAANPTLEGQVVVHHAVEQQVLTRYPGVVSEAEMHSLENLRGIPKSLNSDLHLSQIRREWNQFYRQNPAPTQEQLLQKATEIDNRLGSQFNPPVGPGH